MQSNVTRILTEMDEIMEQAIQEGVFPGAALWIGWRGETIKCSSFGRTADKRYDTYSPTPVTTKTLYDLASLTKVTATTWAIMHLVERGLLRLTDSISTYIPQFGFIQLGEIIHILSSLELDKYTQRYLFEPLGMENTMFNPPETIWDQIAPTEYVEWRGGLLHGRVHDENAWTMGGVAGHAGLFSTIGDLAKFCMMLLGFGKYAGKRVLRIRSIIEMTSPQGTYSNEPFGFGWMINRPYFMGQLSNDKTLGHTGFTGTSIVISPQQGLATVLLFNRVCPTRNGPDIN